ncbi:MAG: hypothetical protein ACR2I2_14860 [Bryobacteraceae bacterium]
MSNPDLSNPDLSNPDLSNGSLTDATWKVTNNGNTAAAYNAKLLINGSAPAGFKNQLIIYRLYTTPAAQNCALIDKPHTVLIANIPRPAFLNPSDPAIATPDLSNPDLSNATFSLAPGDQARITLRVTGTSKAAVVNFLTNNVTLVVVPHEVNTADVQAGSTQPQAIASRLTLVNTPLPNGILGTAYSSRLLAIINPVGRRSRLP